MFFATLGCFDSKAERANIKSERKRDIENAVLTAIYIDLRKFDGKFFHTGELFAISKYSFPVDVQRKLGKFYWQRKLDGDILYFYESQTGGREVTFTFNRLNKLIFVDISNYPVFANQQLRERFGVDKPWPPQY